MKTTQELTVSKFSDRINQVPRSFLRDILEAAVSPDVISFAGGLPNKQFFPVSELAESTARVLMNNPSEALQYSITKGLPQLRELIADFYKNQGLQLNINNILITTGSQQALDLIGKVFINRHDKVIMEEPSYLGSIQAFSMYKPEFISINLENDGINPFDWINAIQYHNPKLTYMIPNFQNPTGTTYSLLKRKTVGEKAKELNTLIVEDDPYSMIRFSGDPLPNIYKYAPENTLLLGSFSKIVVPGFRLGWIVGSAHYIEKLELAKQATDLHTDVFAQHIIMDYLKNNDLKKHLKKITENYRIQANQMFLSLHTYLPNNFKFTVPQGGMFCWLEMPDGFSSMKLFEKAKSKGVIFVPGVPFYANSAKENTARLNFSCSTPEIINKGVKRLAESVNELLQ